nr:hypothetical protein [candidate division Zixibacteria bacterium]
MVHFTISGIETYWWLPALVAFGISTLTSMSGVSGAFLILPFRVSIPGRTIKLILAGFMIFIAVEDTGVLFYR